MSEASEENYSQIIEEIEKEYSKRVDHRHHAIDALTIACTRQGFIQRLSTLHAQVTRDELFRIINQDETSSIEDLNSEISERLNLLDKYFVASRPFTTKQVKEKAAGILVSYKPGKKVAVKGRNIVHLPNGKVYIQKGIIVPRGALSEESVYGRIKFHDTSKPLKYLLEHPDLIVNPIIRERVVQFIEKHKDVPVKEYPKILKKEPILLPSGQPLQEALCYAEDFVIRKPLDANNFKKPEDFESIVDRALRELIKKQVAEKGNNIKEALAQGIYMDEEKLRPIRSVRVFTGLNAVVPVRYDSEGRPVGYVKPGNNHHVAIYQDSEGNLVEHVCTFWHAVERYKYGLPVVIDDTGQLWDNILSGSSTYPQTFLDQLPESGWKLKLSLQLNEYFLMFLEPEKAKEAIQNMDYKLLAHHLFRVYKLSTKFYALVHQYYSNNPNGNKDTIGLKYLRIRSLNALFKINPLKVKVSKIGFLLLND